MKILKYVKAEIEIPLCGIKIIDPEVESIIPEKDYDKYPL